MKIFLSSILLLALLGCASPSSKKSSSSKMVVVTYYSDPPGAVFITPSGKTGFFPLEYSYPITDEFRRGGCMDLDNIQAQWRSGASQNSEGLEICSSKEEGQSFKHTLKRPSHQGLAMDIEKADANGKLSMIQVIRGCDDEKFPSNVRCIKNSYSRFGSAPEHNEVKNFYLLLDGVIEDFNMKKIGVAKAKAEVIKAWQSTIDLSNKRDEDAAAIPIFIPSPIGGAGAGGIDSFTRNQMYQDCLQMARKDARTCIP